MATTALAPSVATACGPSLDRRFQHVLAILVVLSAIKAPLGIPLYLNAGLLLIGLVSLLVVQRVQRIWIWMLVLIALGVVSAASAGSLGSSVPRLGQLLLIVMAASLISRIDPDLLARYLLLLLPAMILVAIAESLLPEPLFGSRWALGVLIDRHAGLHGEPNYNAVLYGVVGIMLAQHRPRVLGALPFLLSLPSLSRALLMAAVVWLGAKAVPGLSRRLAPALVLLLCAQPLLVIGFDSLIGPQTRDELFVLSSHRSAIWAAYSRMGFSEPLGVGYFRGDDVMTDYDDYLWPGYLSTQAHSIFLQTFGEFGWIGYLPFVAFLLHVTMLVRRWAPDEVPVLLFLLTGYGFVNGLSDWPFWVTLAYLLGKVRVGTERNADG